MFAESTPLLPLTLSALGFSTLGRTKYSNQCWMSLTKRSVRAVFAPILVDKKSSKLDKKREGTRRKGHLFYACHVSNLGISKFIVSSYLIVMEYVCHTYFALSKKYLPSELTFLKTSHF